MLETIVTALAIIAGTLIFWAVWHHASTPQNIAVKGDEFDASAARWGYLRNPGKDE